jgi:hypothetical protein
MPQSDPTTSPDEAGPWTEPLTEHAALLVAAERENRCGDLACMARRTSAARRVLAGWTEHADYAWAVEAFEVEIGLRDPALLGKEPDNLQSVASIREQAATEARRELLNVILLMKPPRYDKPVEQPYTTVYVDGFREAIDTVRRLIENSDD